MCVREREREGERERERERERETSSRIERVGSGRKRWNMHSLHSPPMMKKRLKKIRTATNFHTRMLKINVNLEVSSNNGTL